MVRSYSLTNAMNNSIRGNLLVVVVLDILSKCFKKEVRKVEKGEEVARMS